jgi:hypothetical protein
VGRTITRKLAAPTESVDTFTGGIFKESLQPLSEVFFSRFTFATVPEKMLRITA